MQPETAITTLTATLVLLLAHPGSVRAETPRVDVDVKVAAGIEYDSSVGIADLDTNTGEADSARRLEAGIGASIRSSDWLSLRLAVDYSDLAYREFQAFDLGLGHALGELAISTRVADMAVTVEHFDGRLADEPYLALTQYTPSVSKLVGEHLYLRGACTEGRRSYDAAGSRDARTRSYRGDVYLLLDGMRHFLALAVQRTDEDAVATELDYASTAMTASYGREFGLAGRSLGIRARLSRTLRDYDNVTEAIGERRRDERLSLGLVAVLGLTETFELEARLERLQTASNLPAADLDKLRLGIGLTARF